MKHTLTEGESAAGEQLRGETGLVLLCRCVDMWLLRCLCIIHDVGREIHKGHRRG